MYKNPFKNNVLTKKTTLLLGIAFIVTIPDIANAQVDMAQKPVLVITNKAMPSSNSSATSFPAFSNSSTGISASPTPARSFTAPTAPSALYNRPSRAPEVTASQVAGESYFKGGSSLVNGKIETLNKDLFALQASVNRLSEQLRAIEGNGRNTAASYYASIATINTQLQTGTTPGNPRLIQKLDTAQGDLDTLNNNIASLNALAVEIANAASKGSYLLDTTRSTYNLSGAVEEDHARLAQMEDQVNSAIVSVDRLLNDVNDDITRTNAYLNTERNNLRTLSLAVTNGDLYGKSLANHPFSRAPQSNLLQQANYAPAQAAAIAPQAFQPTPSVGAPRPLAKIRFDKPNVNYEQPIYSAVQNALERFPNGRFELIAVHPTGGNVAQVAIESTRSRRNAERVLRTLTQMGVPLEQIDLSYAPSGEARSSEVHLFLR